MRKPAASPKKQLLAPYFLIFPKDSVSEATLAAAKTECEKHGSRLIAIPFKANDMGVVPRVERG